MPPRAAPDERRDRRRQIRHVHDDVVGDDGVERAVVDSASVVHESTRRSRSGARVARDGDHARRHVDAGGDGAARREVARQITSAAAGVEHAAAGDVAEKGPQHRIRIEPAIASPSSPTWMRQSSASRSHTPECRPRRGRVAGCPWAIVIRAAPVRLRTRARGCGAPRCRRRRARRRARRTRRGDGRARTQRIASGPSPRCAGAEHRRDDAGCRDRCGGWRGSRCRRRRAPPPAQRQSLRAAERRRRGPARRRPSSPARRCRRGDGGSRVPGAMR